MPNDIDLATAALDRLVGVLAEDAIFVLASGDARREGRARGAPPRRGYAYTAAVQGQPHARMIDDVRRVGRRDGARDGAARAAGVDADGGRGRARR